jgi:2Fe-2S ferredoxin
MAKIIYVTADGEAQTVEANVGHSVMETAVKNGVEAIIGECGGVGACATCRVYVDKAWTALTGEANAIEREMLEFIEDGHPDVRLSCQIEVTGALDGLVLYLPSSQH